MNDLIDDQKLAAIEEMVRGGVHLAGNLAAQLIEEIKAHRSAAALAEARREGACLIWSHEHGAWWRPNQCGYTVHLEAAGRYTWEEALSICRDARNGYDPSKPPTEIPVRLDDMQFMARALQPKEKADGR